MPNEKVQLKKGLSRNLPSTYTPGDILFETDTGNMYVDVTSAENSSQRVQVKDDTKLPLTGGTLSGQLRVTSSNMRLYSVDTNLFLTNTNSSGRLVLRGTAVTIQSSDESTTYLNANPSGVSFNNRKLLNVATPTANTDGVNKSYVDTAFRELEQEIVNTADDYLPLKGGTMTGSIDMGNYLITSLGTPQSDTDVANKQYVDTKMDKWGDIQGSDSGATLVIKPQDQSNLGTPTTKFGISLTGDQYDGLFLSSTRHILQSKGGGYLSVGNQAYLGAGSLYLSVTNNEVSLVCDSNTTSYVSVSNSGVSLVCDSSFDVVGTTNLSVSGSGAALDNNLSVKGIVDCNTLSLSATTENGISLTEISSGLLGISSSGDVVIRGVSTPLDSTDVANKAYVDNAVDNVSVQWSNVSSKPFTSIGTGLQVSGNVLSVNTSDLVIDDGSLS